MRLENIHSESTNYVSFLDQSRQPRGHRGSDRGSMHSVSSMRSVMSGMSSLWSSFGLGAAGSAARIEKQQLQVEEDLKYLYASFTKIPCLRLAPDRRARIIQGFEEFPFDTAVPLNAFKNVSALEISDLDFRQFFGWDKMAENLRSLTVKRASVDDPMDLLIDIVLDDMDKRRRRSSKAQVSSVSSYASSKPRRGSTMISTDMIKSDSSTPTSPESPSLLEDRKRENDLKIRRSGSVDLTTMTKELRPRSNSPRRPATSRTTSHANVRSSHKMRRSGSGSSSNSETLYNARGSGTNLTGSAGGLPHTKWRFLRHLSLADNSLTSIQYAGLAPLADSLMSLDLSVNLFAEIPDSLASLTALRALNLSNCMINSLHSLLRNPLPAVTSINLRCNRLKALNGIERMLPLERLDLRDNNLADPSELARLTSLPELREIWVAGNPFTKTHANYRITIFNLFRRFPGYAEDVIIDGSGPGYVERKSLVERVPEIANVPTVKPLPPPKDTDKPAPIGQGYTRAETTPREDRPSAGTATIDAYAHGPRRKKVTKRRIVDLSTTDLSPVATKVSSAISKVESGDPPTSSDSTYGISPITPGSMLPPPLPVFRQDLKTSSAERSTTAGTPLFSPTLENQDWNVSGEVYRKKVEALRNEVGNGWLSVLSEEPWDKESHKMDNAFLPESTEPVSPKATKGERVVNTGRTLG